MKINTMHVAASLMACCVVSVAVTLWYMFFEPPWLTYPVQPFPATVYAIKAGEVIPLRVVRCNKDKVRHSYSMARSLVSLDGGQPYVLDDFLTFIDPGCKDTVSLAHVIPKDVKPGRYKMIGMAEVHGTLKTSYVTWDSAEFIVMPL